MTKTATTKIATCYDPSFPPGSARLVEIRRDNHVPVKHRPHGRYLVTIVHNQVGESTHRFPSEEAAIAYAAELGYVALIFAPNKGE